jgi:flagellar FliJ protein
MPAFRFRLQSLLDLRRTERDRRRQELAQALAAEQILQDHRRKLEQEAALMSRWAREATLPGEVRVESLLEGARYGLILAAQRQTLATQFAQLAEEIEARRQRLVEADRQVKALERLRERRLDEHARQLAAREVQALDEAAATRRDPEGRPWPTWRD